MYSLFWFSIPFTYQNIRAVRSGSYTLHSLRKASQWLINGQCYLSDQTPWMRRLILCYTVRKCQTILFRVTWYMKCCPHCNIMSYMYKQCIGIYAVGHVIITSGQLVLALIFLSATSKCTAIPFSPPDIQRLSFIYDVLTANPKVTPLSCNMT